MPYLTILRRAGVLAAEIMETREKEIKSCLFGSFTRMVLILME